MSATTAAAAPFVTITSRLGVHVTTTPHATQRGAEMAARKAIRNGIADQAAVWTVAEAIAHFGRA